MKPMEYQRRGLYGGAVVYKDGGASPQQTQQTSNQSQNTTSTTGPNPTIAPMLQQGVGALGSYFNANPTAPGYYPGSTVAPQSNMTQDAMLNLYNRGVTGSQFMPAASGLVNDTLNGKYLDINNNPYFQKALAAGFAPQTEQFNNSILPNIRSQFEGSGRNLGGADMNQAQIATLGLDRAQSGAAATAANSAYGAERGLQQQTLGLLPSFQNMDYQNIAAQGQAGQTADAYQQALTDSNVARYNFNSMAQPNYISDFLSRTNAGYPGGQTTGSGNSTGFSNGSYTPASNGTSSFLGGGLGLAGLGLSAYSAFSDERLKEDIKPVGKLDDGQNVYSYRYKGEPKTQIGLMAQEVAQVHPEAVSVHPSGYLMVDYAKATPPGGLF